LDNFHPYPVEQNGSDCRQAIHYVVYRLLAIAAINTIMLCVQWLLVKQPLNTRQVTWQLLC